MSRVRSRGCALVWMNINQVRRRASPLSIICPNKEMKRFVLGYREEDERHQGGEKLRRKPSEWHCPLQLVYHKKKLASYAWIYALDFICNWQCMCIFLTILRFFNCSWINFLPLIVIIQWDLFAQGLWEKPEIWSHHHPVCLEWHEETELKQTKSRRTVTTSPRCFRRPTCKATWKTMHKCT